MPKGIVSFFIPCEQQCGGAAEAAGMAAGATGMAKAASGKRSGVAEGGGFIREQSARKSRRKPEGNCGTIGKERIGYIDSGLRSVRRI